MIDKQAATASGEFSIGKALNTMLNPFASVMPGSTYYVPKSLLGKTKGERDAPPLGFTGNTTFDRLLFHGGAVGATALAIAALARYTSHKYQDKKRDADYKKEMADVVGARSPIFSPDPYLGDIAEEQAQQTVGLNKSADVLPWLKAIVPLSMMIGGGYVGYKGMDKYLERKRKQKLDADIDRLSNELDRINYIKLMKARGLKPEDIPPPYAQEDVIGKEARDDAEESVWDTAKSLAALMFLSTAVSSGILAKRYFDAEDPRRQEFKEMQQALKELRMREQRKAPVNVAPLPPAVEAKLDRHLQAIGKRPPVTSHAIPEPQKLEETPVDIPYGGLSVDKSDPTMALL